MERQIKCVLMLSLKEMALRRVAVLLANDSKIPLTYNAVWKEWQDTHEEKVKCKISKLQIPETLREEMIDKVRPLSLEIRNFIECLHEWLQISEEMGFEKLSWTTAGTIDYKKTVEVLLGCEMLDVETRYKLASVCCLEDSIPLLWEELSEDRKKCFSRKTKALSYMEICWPRFLKGDLSFLNGLWTTSDRNLTSFNQWAFERSAREWNKTGSEYFFLGMTQEEREVSLMRTTLDLASIPNRGFYFGFLPDILCYLLLLMTPEQHMQIIKEQPVFVLMCFYMMSWQDLLMQNADLVWPFIPTSDYGLLLEEVLVIAESDCFHVKSFREFFLSSPVDFKKHFVHDECLILGRLCTPAISFLFSFFDKNDSESIECIFRNLDVADRTALVFHPAVLEFFRKQRKEDGRRMVKVCLREAKMSKEDRDRMKKVHPYFRRVLEELYEYQAPAENAKKGQKRKLENSSSE